MEAVGPNYIVLDANILIRAVLGRRARAIIERRHARTRLLVPDVAVVEARRNIPAILAHRGLAAGWTEAVLEEIGALTVSVARDDYGAFEFPARQRMRGRDPKDRPILAVALAFGCPIWTEDRDFFGVGVATWTTDRVELFWTDSVRVT